MGVRASVATLFFATAADEDGARKYAADRLAESVEIWEDDTLIFKVSRQGRTF